MLKKIAFGVVILVLGVAVLTYGQPDNWTVSRSIEIEKPVGRIFSVVDDFKTWSHWSPWSLRDPSMERRISEPSSGLGAKQEWVSAQEGAGYQVTEKHESNRLLVHRLVFTAPFEDVAFDEWHFEELSEAKSKVTWVMKGQNDTFVKKFFYMAMNLEKMIAKDFESGLANLKEYAFKFNI